MRIKAVRKAFFKSAVAFARALSLWQQTYHTYESHREPPVAVLNKIVELTGCNEAWLLTGLGGMNDPDDPVLEGILMTEGKDDEVALSWVRDRALHIMREYLRATHGQNAQLLDENARLIAQIRVLTGTKDSPESGRQARPSPESSRKKNEE